MFASESAAAVSEGLSRPVRSLSLSLFLPKLLSTPVCLSSPSLLSSPPLSSLFLYFLLMLLSSPLLLSSSPFLSSPPLLSSSLFHSRSLRLELSSGLLFNTFHTHSHTLSNTHTHTHTPITVFRAASRSPSETRVNKKSGKKVSGVKLKNV